MAKLKVTQFVDLVKRSGLVDDERLSEALSGVDLLSVKDSGIVASSLTKAGLLTEWQSEKLLQGRYKSFYLGKYKLLNHIGTGGMGAVYLAEHTVMRHRVAIKLLPSHLAAHTSYLERFHQEARASASLHHPNMVRAIDVDHEDNMHYLVMDYVDGVDLQAMVSRNGPLDPRTAADYTRQAAEGLAYAHRSGLIHRDIKPANLLVDKQGVLKILDMGLARFTDESQGSLTQAYDQKMIGTVDYLAPEQAIDSHHVDSRVDIYSLGCTLYFMLTGDAPFPQGTIPQRLMQHQSAEPTDIHTIRSDVPDELVKICKKMMAKKAIDRYQSADEVSAALADWLGLETDHGAQKYVPPIDLGPSQNENLTLAPLDDDTGRKGAKAGDSVVGGASKSGVKGPGSSVVRKAGGSGIKGSPSGVKGNSGGQGGSGVKRGSGVKGGSGVKSGSGVKGDSSAGRASGSSAKPASGIKSPPATVSKPVDLMDELLSEPVLPAQEVHRSGPTPTMRLHQDNQRAPLWQVAAVGIGGAALIVLAILSLIWFAGI